MPSFQSLTFPFSQTFFISNFSLSVCLQFYVQYWLCSGAKGQHTLLPVLSLFPSFCLCMSLSSFSLFVCNVIFGFDCLGQKSNNLFCLLLSLSFFFSVCLSHFPSLSACVYVGGWVGTCVRLSTYLSISISICFYADNFDFWMCSFCKKFWGFSVQLCASCSACSISLSLSLSHTHTYTHTINVSMNGFIMS